MWWEERDAWSSTWQINFHIKRELIPWKWCAVRNSEIDWGQYLWESAYDMHIRWVSLRGRTRLTMCSSTTLRTFRTCAEAPRDIFETNISFFDTNNSRAMENSWKFEGKLKVRDFYDWWARWTTRSCWCCWGISLNDFWRIHFRCSFESHRYKANRAFYSFRRTLTLLLPQALDSCLHLSTRTYAFHLFLWWKLNLFLRRYNNQLSSKARKLSSIYEFYEAPMLIPFLKHNLRCHQRDSSVYWKSKHQNIIINRKNRAFQGFSTLYSELCLSQKEVLFQFETFLEFSRNVWTSFMTQRLRNTVDELKFVTYGIFNPTQPATTCPEWMPMRIWKSSPGRWRISNFDARFNIIKANEAIWLAWSELRIGSPLTTWVDVDKKIINEIFSLKCLGGLLTKDVMLLRSGSAGMTLLTSVVW